MDNGHRAVNGKTHAVVPAHMVDSLLKEFFGWRTPTKKYNTFWERYTRLGSSQFDAFIAFLIQRGYYESNRTIVTHYIITDEAWQTILENIKNEDEKVRFTE